MVQFLHAQGPHHAKAEQRDIGLNDLYAVSTLTITVVISSLILHVDNLGNCCALSVVGYILADFLKILRIHDRFLSFQEEAPLLMY